MSKRYTGLKFLHIVMFKRYTETTLLFCHVMSRRWHSRLERSPRKRGVRTPTATDLSGK